VRRLPFLEDFFLQYLELSLRDLDVVVCFRRLILRIVGAEVDRVATASPWPERKSAGNVTPNAILKMADNAKDLGDTIATKSVIISYPADAVLVLCTKSEAIGGGGTPRITQFWLASYSGN
jgi:hypothetical protein